MAETSTENTLNARIPPPSVKYDDVWLPYDRLQEASKKAWPPRQHLEAPEFAKDADPYDVVEAMKRVGGVIVRNIVSEESVAQMEKDIRPALEADTPWDAGDNFFPPTTRRAFGLVGKSRTFALDIIGNELYQAVCEQFLTTKSYPRYGNRNNLNISPPQVNNTIAFSVRPG